MSGCTPSRCAAPHCGVPTHLRLFLSLLALVVGAPRAARAQSTILPPADASVSSPATSAARVGSADSLVVTLVDVRRLVLSQNAAFLAAREETAIARGGLRQARLFRFNPDLQAQLPGMLVGRSDEPGTITLTQEVEIAGQRGVRLDAARFGVERASAGVTNAARLTVADASVAFFQALAAERRLTVTQSVLALNERLVLAVRTQLREGEISLLDANLAEIEVGRARGRVLAAQREATAARLELARQLGLTPTTALRLEDRSGDELPLIADTADARGVVDATRLPSVREDSLLALALARRADLVERTAAIREADASTDAARRERIPNLRLGIFAERRPETGAGSEARFPRVGPALGITLPFLNRNQGVVAQRRALATQARFAREATALQVRTDVATAVRAYETATAELAVFTATVLDPARRNSTLLDTAFQAGKIPLPTLLLLRNQLLDAELGYWHAWLAQHAARVQLDAATGALQPPPPDASASPSPSAGSRR